MTTKAVTNCSSADFGKILQDHADFHMRASEALRECVQASRQENASSTLTLTFKITPKKGGKVIQVTPQTPKLKLPKEEWASKPYFCTENNQLLRDDPDQMQLLDETQDPKIEVDERV